MTLSADTPKRSDRHAQLVWFDPGATTGVFALAIRPAWLEGSGPPTWEGLRKAITTSWCGQIGRTGKVWNERDGKAAVSQRVAPKIDGQAPMPSARDDARSMTMVEELAIVRQCESVLDLWPEAAWGYESFEVRPGMHSGPDYLSPVRLAAALTYAETSYGERARLPFVQSAAMAKTTATDPRLSAAGLYRPGMPHATDAARHCATFLRRARGDAELRSWAWPRIFRAASPAA